MNLSYNQIQKLLRLIDRELINVGDNAYRYRHFDTGQASQDTADKLDAEIKELKILKEELKK